MRLPLLLALSLCVNVGLFATLARHPAHSSPANAPTLAAAEHGGASTSGATSPSATTVKSGGPTNLWGKLATEDMRELVARLRAAGFPPNVVRSIVEARLRAKYMSRVRELTAEYENLPFWKPDPFSNGNAMKLYEKVNLVYREMSKEMRSLLGEDIFAMGSDPEEAQKRQFGSIPKAKIDSVQRIEDDYSEMNAQIRASTQGITLPEDREKLALLEREKHADLATVLTPEELADYEMRHSPITTQLRPALTLMDASEAEFRTIYDAMAQYREKFAPMSGVMASDLMEQREQAQQKANDAIKAALGDARYAEYDRAANRDYQQLYRLAQRNGVSVDAANSAYAVIASTTAESVRIAQDTSRSREDRRAALKTLAENARLQLPSVLGPTAGAAYLESARWLRPMENGMGVNLSSASGMGYRTVPMASANAGKK